MPDPLHSTDNALVKELVRLHDARHRAETGLMLIEGRRAIDGCLEAGWKPKHLLVRDTVNVPDHWGDVRIMSNRVAERVSQATTPSGYLAVFPVPVPPKLEVAAGGLVLCGLSDPGNVGTLMRCAGAFAIRQLVLVGGCDPWGHKVVQAAAVLAVGATAVAFVAGVGTYLFIRFTQHRSKPPGEEKSPRRL